MNWWMKLSTGQFHSNGFDLPISCSKKKSHPGVTVFKAGIREPRKSRSRHPFGGVGQMPTGHLHLNGFDSLLLKKEGTLRVPSFLSRIRESNPPSRLGKPLYYRYTNPAFVKVL